MRFSGKRCSTLLLLAFTAFGVSVEAANPRSGKVSVPVMTPLTVKLEEAVNARSVANGTGFTASIKDPVQVDGVTVIPAHSSAAGLVSKEPTGAGQMMLNSIFVNGKMYRITTSPIPFTQKSNLRAGSTMTFYLVLSLNIAR